MNKAFLFFFLLYSPVAAAQLSDDSLKLICKNMLKTELSSMIGEESRYQINIEELFSGCFKKTRVFLAAYSNNPSLHSHDYPVYKLYALNSANGEKAAAGSVQEFNEVFSSPSVANLDKCYLYLLFAFKLKDRITNPRNHRKSLSNNSVFLKDASGLFFRLCYPCKYTDIYPSEVFEAQISEDIYRSTKNNIFIFSFSEETVYRYQFVFGRKGKIEKVDRVRLAKQPE